VSGVRVELKGMEDAQKQLKRIERGAKAMANYEATVYSKLPYAYGIEYGRHRKSGKLARRAGGATYIRRAVETVTSGMDADISEGLSKVTAPGPWIYRRLAGWARRLARQNAPRGPKKKGRSYRLNRSLQYKVRKRGQGG
jgi:hypothetical protein